jgi:hypothetical protein
MVDLFARLPMVVYPILKGHINDLLATAGQELPPRGICPIALSILFKDGRGVMLGIYSDREEHNFFAKMIP